MDGTRPSPAAPAAAHAKAPRPRAVWGLVVALALLIPFSAPAGWALIADPSGASLQILANDRGLLPVSDFFLVGLLLLAFYTLAPPLIIAGLVTRREFGPTRILSDRLGLHWSWFAAVTLGAVLIGWIATEMYLFQSAPSGVMTALWFICIALALCIFLAAMPRQVRVHYRVSRGPSPRPRTTAS